jgi:hypothetical protein
MARVDRRFRAAVSLAEVSALVVCLLMVHTRRGDPNRRDSPPASVLPSSTRGTRPAGRADQEGLAQQADRSVALQAPHQNGYHRTPSPRSRTRCARHDGVLIVRESPKLLHDGGMA